MGALRVALRVLRTEISLQIQNTVVSFVCFSFKLVRRPTHCPDDRAL